MLPFLANIQGHPSPEEVFELERDGKTLESFETIIQPAVEAEATAQMYVSFLLSILSARLSCC